MAHLVNFMGSDTISGVRAANFYYDIPMAAFSVPASEHTIQTAFGSTSEQQVEYLRAMIRTYGKPGAILSIVIDGYHTFREATALCTVLKDEIVASGAKVVFRPDSGDPLEIVPKLLQMQADAFGYDTNELGYKKIRTVGVIQGDGVDALMIDMLLLKIANMGFRADNIVFGSGGALLQKVNRDTYKFAQKACAILVRNPDGSEEWVGISKDPITDPGKKSKAGVLTLARSNKTGEYRTISRNAIDAEWEDQMQVVYRNGELFNLIKFDEVRANTGLW
jgi:nicotinamide phosphoribosyltransferase